MKCVERRFHGNFCTSNVVSCHSPCFRVCFDASLHQLRLLLGDSDAIVLFDGLPEKWVPAVALWRPGDSVRVKLLPETAASASQQCELEKNDVTVLNAVSDDAFKLFSLLLKDVVSQLRDGREESRLWAFRDRFIHRENYLCGYVFPLLASVSLLRLSFAQWTALADLLLVVIKQLEMEAFHHPLTPAKEFLDCLALHFVLSPLRDDPVVCEDRFLQNGLRLSELPREDRFLQNGLRLSELPREDEGVACEEDRSEDERELSQCRTLLANSTAESQQLYRSLMQATSLPSLKLRSDKAFLKRCYCCFTYCCHHLSLVGLSLLTRGFME